VFVEVSDMRKPTRFVSSTLTTVLALTLVVWAAPVQASAAVTIDSDAKLAPSGAVTLRLTIVCDPGREVLEAHVTVSQDEQRISGTAGIAGIRCDGRPHRVKARITPTEGSFREGEGYASAFILLLDPSSSTTEQAQDARSITIK
jgi:hypothetical protein